jgi:hypothetical protein
MILVDRTRQLIVSRCRGYRCRAASEDQYPGTNGLDSRAVPRMQGSERFDEFRSLFRRWIDAQNRKPKRGKYVGKMCFMHVLYSSVRVTRTKTWAGLSDTWIRSGLGCMLKPILHSRFMNNFGFSGL